MPPCCSGVTLVHKWQRWQWQLSEVVPLFIFTAACYTLWTHHCCNLLNLTYWQWTLFFPANVKTSLLADIISQPSASLHVGVIFCSFGVPSPPLPESSPLKASATHLNTSPSDWWRTCVKYHDSISDTRRNLGIHSVLTKMNVGCDWRKAQWVVMASVRWGSLKRAKEIQNKSKSYGLVVVWLKRSATGA